MTWRDSKDAGKEAFQQEEFHESLKFFLGAIDLLKEEEEQEGGSTNSNSDRPTARGSHQNKWQHQLLLSNAVACRLRIGGREMIEKAVEEAKKVRLYL